MKEDKHPSSAATPDSRTDIPVCPDGSLAIHRRHLPHWQVDGGIYFITFRIRQGTSALSTEERRIVLEVILKGMELHFQLAPAVVMPDHVHLLLRPRPSIELSRIMKGIKGASARRINELRVTSRQSVWQDESWDRIVRDAIEFWQKLEYMHWNPAKAGLVKADEVYPFWFLNRDFL